MLEFNMGATIDILITLAYYGTCSSYSCRLGAKCVIIQGLNLSIGRVEQDTPSPRF